jgi:hypothetical protein
VRHAVVMPLALCAALAAGGFGPGRPKPVTAAPVPKYKPRPSLIVVVPGHPCTPARLFSGEGNFIGELPFDDVWSCTLSPGGTLAAVVVAGPTNRACNTSLYVVGTRANRELIQTPLATGLNYPVVAWGTDGRLYVSERDDKGPGGWLRPAGVKVHDLARRTVTAAKELQTYCIQQASPDGKWLLAHRVASAPAERYEAAILDAKTGRRADVDAGGVTLWHFLGAGKLLGTRAKAGAGGEAEHVIFDLAGKRASPVPLPAVVRGGTARVFDVLPSPDGRRLLYLWDDDVPAPADWPLAGPCRAARMTITDLDGGNPRTIFRPDIRERSDEARNHVGSVDWR